MARFTDTDRFDDDDDMPSHTKPKSGFPVWLIVVLCAAPIFAMVAIAGAIAMFTMRASHVQRAEAQAAQNEASVVLANGPAAKGKAGLKRVYTRAEFNALVGLMPADVTASVGPPEFRIVDGARTTWHYHNKTVDKPVTDKLDPVTKVVFKDGVVVEVSFQADDSGSKAK